MPSASGKPRRKTSTRWPWTIRRTAVPQVLQGCAGAAVDLRLLLVVAGGAVGAEVLQRRAARLDRAPQHLAHRRQQARRARPADLVGRRARIDARQVQRLARVDVAGAHHQLARQQRRLHRRAPRLQRRRGSRPRRAPGRTARGRARTAACAPARRRATATRRPRRSGAGRSATGSRGRSRSRKWSYGPRSAGASPKASAPDMPRWISSPPAGLARRRRRRRGRPGRCAGGRRRGARQRQPQVLAAPRHLAADGAHQRLRIAAQRPAQRQAHPDVEHPRAQQSARNAAARNFYLWQLGHGDFSGPRMD